MRPASMKLQSAIEYLSTYGWAILIISIALAALFTLVIPQINSPTACIFPAGFSCLSYYLAQNGMLTLNLVQSTQYPISVTAIGCNSKQDVATMNTANIVTPVQMAISSNYTYNLFCYNNDTSAFSGQLNTPYAGYLILNYTNAYTLFPNTIFGRLQVKVSH